MLPGGVRPRAKAPSVSVLHTPPPATISSACYILLGSLHTPPLATYPSVRSAAETGFPLAVGPPMLRCLQGACVARPTAPSVSVLHTPPLATYSSACYILLSSLHTPPLATYSSVRSAAETGFPLAVGPPMLRCLQGACVARPTAPSVSVLHTPPLATYSSACYILLRSLHTPPLATYSSVHSAAETGFPLAVGPPMLRCFQAACVRVPRRQV